MHSFFQKVILGFLALVFLACALRVSFAQEASSDGLDDRQISALVNSWIMNQWDVTLEPASVIAFALEHSGSTPSVTLFPNPTLGDQEATSDTSLAEKLLASRKGQWQLASFSERASRAYLAFDNKSIEKLHASLSAIAKGSDVDLRLQFAAAIALVCDETSLDDALLLTLICRSNDLAVDVLLENRVQWTDTDETIYRFAVASKRNAAVAEYAALSIDLSCVLHDTNDARRNASMRKIATSRLLATSSSEFRYPYALPATCSDKRLKVVFSIQSPGDGDSPKRVPSTTLNVRMTRVFSAIQSGEYQTFARQAAAQMLSRVFKQVVGIILGTVF